VAQISASDVKTLREKTGAGMMDCKRALADANGDPEKAVEVLRERGLARAVKREGRETSEGTIGMTLEPGLGALVELGCETDFVAKTDDFQRLAAELAGQVASDASLTDAGALLGASLGDDSVDERIKTSIGKLGENIVLKRVARLASDGSGRVGGYVHAGGKLGVLVALRTELESAEIDALAKDVAMHVAAADPTPVSVDKDGVPQDFLDRESELFRRQAVQEGRPEKIIDRIVEGRIQKVYKEVCLLEQPFVKDPERSVRQVLEDASQRLGGEISVSGFARFKLGEGASA
jgi:elongation factor Ts